MQVWKLPDLFGQSLLDNRLEHLQFCLCANGACQELVAELHRLHQLLTGATVRIPVLQPADQHRLQPMVVPVLAEAKTPHMPSS